MRPEQLHRTYLDLTTPHVADACMRLGIEVRCAPPGTGPLWSGTHLAGRVRPARHYGSVDVFLEAIERAKPGDVLVVDNGGRQDEACVGDLVTLEASRAGLAGILIWGLHRDTTELRTIRLPVFSQGTLPVGPQRLDPRDPDALVSCSSRSAAPPTSQKWPPRSGTRNAPRRRKCTWTPHSGLRPVWGRTSQPAPRTPASPSVSTCVRSGERSKSSRWLRRGWGRFQLLSVPQGSLWIYGRPPVSTTGFCRLPSDSLGVAATRRAATATAALRIRPGRYCSSIAAASTAAPASGALP